MDYVTESGLRVLFLNESCLLRAFQLMSRYADAPMDLADASLVAVAEARNLVTIFTIDRKDFNTYRLKRGHRYVPFEIVGLQIGR